MAEVLCDCVYREVAILKESESTPAYVAIISYDEKPGIQAIGNTASDRHSLECTRRSRATTKSSATAHSVCWPRSIAEEVAYMAVLKIGKREFRYTQWRVPPAGA